MKFDIYSCFVFKDKILRRNHPPQEGTEAQQEGDCDVQEGEGTEGASQKCRDHLSKFAEHLAGNLPQAHNHIRAMFPVPMEAAEGTTTATGVPNHPDE